MIWRSVFSPVTKMHVEQRILNTHPLHLFRIIQDVDQYSSFLPLCSHSKILGYSASNKPTRQSDNGAIKGDGTLRFDAVLTVGLPPFFEETYVSAVTVKPNQLTVETRSISSKLFDSLRSRWQLSYVQDNANKISNLSQCKVHFEVEMTVSDPLVVGTLDTVLEQVAGRQVQAFADRCHQIPMPLDLRQ